MIPKPDSCQPCPLYSYPLGSKFGFLRPDGAFKKGVLIVGEAAGQQEEQAGLPFIGKAGYYLWNNLKRVGLDRDDFRIANVLSCRPPDNKLVGMPYESLAIDSCRHHLDAIIRMARLDRASSPLVILTLGKTAFKRVTGFTPALHDRLLKLDYLCYPFYIKEYDAWVIAADHPSYLMRGNHHLISVLQFAALRAVDIAQNGFTPAQEAYIMDPDPLIFLRWVNTYKAVLEQNPDLVLSYDIETLMKQDQDEEDVAKEEDPDYTILRCSFSYQPHNAVTVPWKAEYMPALQTLFGSEGKKVGWNNNNYDNPRIERHMPINGPNIDAMLGWHVLNSALPKGLGFVAPYYAKQSQMWKHMSEAEPAWYNAKDSDIQLQCWLGIEKDLKGANLWNVFDYHVTQLNQLFHYMSHQGVQRDEDLRSKAEAKLDVAIKDIQCQIEACIPSEAKSYKVYKKTPKSLDGLVQLSGQKRTTKRCSTCLSVDVGASHFKSVGKKKLKAGAAENPCFGAACEKVKVDSSLWALALEFKLSNKALQTYQKVQNHKPVLHPKERRIVFDEKAMLRLQRTYRDDPLYPLVGKFRKYQKLLSTYIGVTNSTTGVVSGGLPIGKDGLIHTHFTHNPSTLRSASQNPNLQNLPRSGSPDDPATIIRNLVVARPGHTFLARDFSGIEAVLVGYFAQAPNYIRLSKHDVHSFYTAYALHELDGRVHANDLPLLSWDDDRLFTRLVEIKREFKEDRNSLYKHLVHGANFMQSPKGAAEKIFSETGVEYDTKLVHRVMEIYFELFPEIRVWHKTVMAQTDRDGYIRNPFGYVHRFFRVFEWEKVGDQWQKIPGPDANKVIAFGPQSSAAGIIKEAMLRLYQSRFEEAGQYLRLLIHDELFLEVPSDLVDSVDEVLRIEMEKPILCMPLLPAWGMGDHLNINTEAKRGDRWGEMK
jgi:uracil-DNA glycosylase family 4